jgi:hypothetical protein
MQVARHLPASVADALNPLKSAIPFLRVMPVVWQGTVSVDLISLR